MEVRVSGQFHWMVHVILQKLMSFFSSSGHSLFLSDLGSSAHFVTMATANPTTAEFSREEQRTVIRFLFLEGLKGAEIHRRLVAVLGDNAMCLQAVYKWVEQFKSGRNSVQDAPRSGRPSAVNDDQVAEIGEFVRANRNCTLEDIEVQTSVNRETARQILSERLNMRKLKSQWVPHTLTEDQAKQRVELSSLHLQRARREGELFFSRIVAGDETWVASFEPELPQQLAVWRGNSFGTGQVQLAERVKPKHEFKVMHIVFFDHLGLLLDHAVPRNTSVTAVYYRDILREKLRPAIRKKRPDLLERGVILLHDNARPHVAGVVSSLLASYGWETLDHPPYSPDLSPCDFFLFGKLKAKLRGRRFGTEEAINAATKQALTELAMEGFRDGIFGLQQQWEKCVRTEGRYLES